MVRATPRARTPLRFKSLFVCSLEPFSRRLGKQLLRVGVGRSCTNRVWLYPCRFLVKNGFGQDPSIETGSRKVTRVVVYQNGIVILR